MTFTIRSLRADEAELYRDIRLESLRLHPEAFGSSLENEAAQPLSFFAGRLTGNVIFGGFRDQELLGTAGFMPQSGAKREHKATLWGMYVRQPARGTGLARGLVEAVLEYGEGKAELIQLSVVAENTVARRLYSSLGFEPYGIEARSLKVDGRYHDEVLMVRMLT